jgi:hypothetical protein
MSILKRLFGCSKIETQTKGNLKDIDSLVEKARNSGSIEDLNTLYSALLDLDEWNYIVSNNCKIEEAKPFIGIVDDKPWLFVFTDRLKADQYAKTFGNFLESNGNTLVLSMNLSNSLNMIQQLHDKGVYGIRINEGENGWFIDVQGLFNIKNYLKK